LTSEYDYQLKFVVDSLDDCQEVENWLAEFTELDRSRVLLMPQGTDAVALQDKAYWLEPYCRHHKLSYCPRKHIEWFGHVRGT
jgi:7-carboxy-7-deazaguanine synthase